MEVVDGVVYRRFQYNDGQTDVLQLLLPRVLKKDFLSKCHGDMSGGHKGKGKGLDTCYSTTYMSQTRDQQRFTISEVAADWHEPMVLQRIMWPSITRANGQLDPRCS